MNQKLTLVLMHPREKVFDVLFEHTCELAPYLTYVEQAVLLQYFVSRDGKVHTVQQWRANAKIHPLLSQHLDDGLFEWKFSSQRNPGEFKSSWLAESGVHTATARCLGTVCFEQAAGGRGTRIVLELNLLINIAALRTIFGALLVKHWREMIEAAGLWIEAQEKNKRLPKV
jgi:hypothetical protein